MINRLRELVNKEPLEVPTPQALARYHLFESIRYLNELYKGNTSYTELTKFKELVNVIVQQNKLNKYDHIKAKMFSDGEILNKYKPIILIKSHTPESAIKKVDQLRKNLKIEDQYFILIQKEEKENEGVEIISVLHNDHIRDYYKILENKIENGLQEIA